MKEFEDVGYDLRNVNIDEDVIQIVDVDGEDDDMDDEGSKVVKNQKKFVEK